MKLKYAGSYKGKVRSHTRHTKHGITTVHGYDRALPSTTNSGTVTPSTAASAVARRNRTKAITSARNAASAKRYGTRHSSKRY